MELDQNNKTDILNTGGQKSSGMKVPDGYFESFEESILSKVQMESKEAKVVSLNAKSNTWKILTLLAVAASLIWAALWVFTPNEGGSIEQNQIAEITVDDLEYYEGMDDYLLAENITVTELEEIDLSEDYITADEIFEYMSNEDLSEYTLTENF
jgi:hypothetical protein